MVEDQRLDIAVSTGLEDEDDLRSLAQELSVQPPFEARGLDGQAVLTLVVSGYISSIPVIKAWLETRAQRGKGCSININGRKISGYTADDAARIIKALNEAAAKNGIDDSDQAQI